MVFSDDVTKRAIAAAARGNVLRYMITIDDGVCCWLHLDASSLELQALRCR